MIRLITFEDIRDRIGIPLNTNQAKDLNPKILDAQDFDLRPFLGEQLYLDLIEDFSNSPSLVKYNDLFNGSTYTYNGKKYQHDGVKAILVYHSYARYSGRNSIKDTPFGFTQKKNEHSDHASEKAIARIVAEERSKAQAHEDRVRMFLHYNREDYPLYNCHNTKRRSTGVRIKRIG